MTTYFTCTFLSHKIVGIISASKYSPNITAPPLFFNSEINIKLKIFFVTAQKLEKLKRKDVNND